MSDSEEPKAKKNETKLGKTGKRVSTPMTQEKLDKLQAMRVKALEVRKQNAVLRKTARDKKELEKINAVEELNKLKIELKETKKSPIILNDESVAKPLKIEPIVPQVELPEEVIKKVKKSKKKIIIEKSSSDTDDDSQYAKVLVVKKKKEPPPIVRQEPVVKQEPTPADLKKISRDKFIEDSYNNLFNTQPVFNPMNRRRF
jgi:hypothetical protein